MFTFPKVVILCALLGASALATWAVLKKFREPVVTSTIYEACRYSTPDGGQSGCELSTPANATKVTVTRHAH